MRVGKGGGDGLVLRLGVSREVEDLVGRLLRGGGGLDVRVEV